ncbi:MAG TPA: hypothetical protein VGJ05_13690 [Fimbriiglobus sp.]|jgi:cytochrome c556
MKTNSRLLIAVAVVGCAAVATWQAAVADDKGKGSPPTAQGQPPMTVQLPNRKKIMDDKLKYTQQILTGLALNDRDKIKTAADKLVALSQLAEWLNADKTDEYQFQMKVFQRAAKRIGRRAGEKNFDGVMLAYTELTQTCLRCHQVERDFR